MSRRPSKPPLAAKAPREADACLFHCDVRASFATAFSAWRKQNNIRLKTIAVSLGVSIATVSSWESGQCFPGGRNFEKLVEFTGLPPCKLFCVMADKCVPADCLLAISKITSQHALTPGTAAD